MLFLLLLFLVGQKIFSYKLYNLVFSVQSNYLWFPYCFHFLILPYHHKSYISPRIFTNTESISWIVKQDFPREQ